MNTFWKAPLVAALMAILVLGAVAQSPNALANHQTVLVGTTGACNSDVQGGPCTQQSTLVQLDPTTGALIQVIGPVGFTVNGLAWDRKLHKLFATTSLGDVRFHGLITIDLVTGKGKP